MNARQNVLSVCDLRKSFARQQVLAIRRFGVAQGQCVLLFGDNSSGKTTLLKILAGLLLPDAVGEWTFNRRPQKPTIGGISGAVLLHQKPYLFSTNVHDNIAIAAASPAQVGEAMEWAGLTAAAKESARVLSGGMQQRVSLARIRAAQPKLCLLDEPETHLDSEGKLLIADLTATLQKRGAAIIIAAPTKTQTAKTDTIWHLTAGDIVAADIAADITPSANTSE